MACDESGAGDFPPVSTFLWTTFVGSVVLQVLFFTCAAGFKMDKVTDLVYGANFIVVAAVTLGVAGMFTFRSLVVSISVIVWGVRLAGYLFYRILKIGNDARFDGTREVAWKFFIWFMIQAITVWTVSLPVIILNAVSGGVRKCEIGSGAGEAHDSPALHPVDIVGWVLIGIGFLAEAIADQQKFSFKMKDDNKGKWIQSGLWKWSRHPNYFGEVSFWWGIFLASVVELEGGEYAAVIGPIFITMIIMCGSGVPTTERSADQRYWYRDDYQAYKKRTAVCMLFPPVLSALPQTFKFIFCCEYRCLYEKIPEPPTDAEKGEATRSESTRDESSSLLESSAA